jgi:hypothetical protein
VLLEVVRELTSGSEYSVHQFLVLRVPFLGFSENLAEVVHHPLYWVLPPSSGRSTTMTPLMTRLVTVMYMRMGPLASAAASRVGPMSTFLTTASAASVSPVHSNVGILWRRR